jgi:hypothetical protein
MYSSSVWLPSLHVTDVTAVVEDGVPLSGVADYEWTTLGELCHRYRCWSTVARGIVVSFTHGYPTGHPTLEAVRDVCLAAAIRLTDNPASVRSWTVGGESATYAGGGAEVTATLTEGEKMSLPTLPRIR